MHDQRIWVEPVGSVIVARLRGKPTAELLRGCEARVLELTRDTQQVRVLYDALELEPPDMDLVLLQKQLGLAATSRPPRAVRLSRMQAHPFTRSIIRIPR